MTNDKTVTMSRELAERISARLERLNAGFCELRALLAAPVVESQEPVAEVLSSRVGNDTSTIDKALQAGTKLYTSPTAPVAVVHPFADKVIR